MFGIPGGILKLILGGLGIAALGYGGTDISSVASGESDGLSAGGIVSMVIGLISFLFLVQLIFDIIGCLITGVIIVGIGAALLAFSGMIDVKGLFGLADDASQAAQTVTDGVQVARDMADNNDLSDNPKRAAKQLAVQYALDYARDRMATPEAAAALAQPAAVNSVSGAPAVADGDTIFVNGLSVRLFGIDAPEPGEPCPAPSRGDCGAEAATFLDQLTAGKTVTCDIRDSDGAGNGVGTCSVDGIDLGAAMVAGGWATAHRQYSETYVPYEDAARTRRSGLWAD